MKTFLHVGCGPMQKDGTTRTFNTSEWKEIRFDIDESVNPDVIGTMVNMSAVATDSVDAIFSSHNIEHLYPHEVPLALGEFLRVLRADGVAIITCPDLQSICTLVVNDGLTEPAYMSSVGPISPIDVLYGHRVPMANGNLYMAHRTGFTQKTLANALSEAGFQAVVTDVRPQHFDIWAVATKSPRSNQELIELAEAHFPY
ncbi:MAG: methyltransferase domain-containing protein [Rhodoferax sp.]